jgi:hypothetical protein
MAITPTIQASQASVTAVTGGETSDILVAQAYVTAIANFPTERIDTSQFYVSTITGGATSSIQVGQSYITVVCRGRVEDPKVRAWTYTMDGHDYYVLRLGVQETLVYDTHSEQWYSWGSDSTNLWRPFDGTNWLGGDIWSDEYGSNVVVGDDGNGSLYLLDPTSYVDDHPSLPDPTQFERIIQGQVVKRGHDNERCYSVELNGSIGEMTNADLTTVTLYTSDDQGNTYVDQGTVTIPDDCSR